MTKNKIKIFSYDGIEPTVIAAELQKGMLDVMREQLKIIEQMTLTIILVPEGSRLMAVGTQLEDQDSDKS